MRVDHRQLLLSILDSALEITALPTATASVTDSMDQLNQRQRLSSETSQDSDLDDESRVATSPIVTDISLPSENTTRGRMHHSGTNTKRRRTNEKLTDVDRQ